MLEKFKNGDYLEYYDFNENIKEKIINSLNRDEIAFRCDWGLENGIPKLYEINAESCGFILECSLIPNLIEDISGKNYLTDYLLQLFHIPQNLNLKFTIGHFADNHLINYNRLITSQIAP